MNQPMRLSGGLDETLARGILDALDSLLRALELEPMGDDRFRVVNESARFDRAFGGQLVAQALVGAGATAEGRMPHSLHAYFAESADTAHPLELAVDRVRDGRSTSIRRVTVRQGERPVLTLLASFRTDRGGADRRGADGDGARGTGAEGATAPTPDGAPVPPDGAPVPPDDVPVLQHWARQAPEHGVPPARAWVDNPPPVELRIDQPPSFMGGGQSVEARTHFMRLTRAVGDDPLLHAALLTYASDYLLLDMAYRADPDRYRPDFAGSSLDHALWLYRPVRFDHWHRTTQELVGLADGRGLVRGTIHDEDRLVASVMQEVMVRPRR